MVRVRVRVSLKFRLRLRLRGCVVGSVLVATPGSVHRTFIKLQLLMLRLKLKVRLRLGGGVRRLGGGVLA